MKRYLVCYLGSGNAIVFEQSFDTYKECSEFIEGRKKEPLSYLMERFIIDRGPGLGWFITGKTMGYG